MCVDDSKLLKFYRSPGPPSALSELFLQFEIGVLLDQAIRARDALIYNAMALKSSSEAGV
jgi:hypothetical protein